MINIKKIKSDTSPVKAVDLFVTFLIVTGCFSLIFYGTDIITGTMAKKHKIYFDWELNIPFIPAAFIPYFGIFALPATIPFTVKQRNKLYFLALRLVIAIIVAGVVFLLIPSKLGYMPRQLSPGFESFVQAVAGKNNLIPSLHVCLTFIICHSIFPGSGKAGRFLIYLTMILLPLSTILTHQHHVIDVITGLLLAMMIIIYLPKPNLRHELYSKTGRNC